jgi:hypothetical protein
MTVVLIVIMIIVMLAVLIAVIGEVARQEFHSIRTVESHGHRSFVCLVRILIDGGGEFVERRRDALGLLQL